ncbi:hypothetical protein HCD_01290 [Helicobacter cetorum MIT 99-5656]|uniref:Uncharacterized protein n=1 Tax=Helicobacter cetorum (strain ATCC BAA-540 / CCUG 52418 / MIT 99-5656) TaxID=1163745 RepID=I0EQS1_HELCM|nr:hypothetical protein HCD_01290 [Helicobacter cetorum MIT 99-5656]
MSVFLVGFFGEGGVQYFAVLSSRDLKILILNTLHFLSRLIVALSIKPCFLLILNSSMTIKIIK